MGRDEGASLWLCFILRIEAREEVIGAIVIGFMIPENESLENYWRT